jgi:hypothetical protein
VAALIEPLSQQESRSAPSTRAHNDVISNRMVARPISELNTAVRAQWPSECELQSVLGGQTTEYAFGIRPRQSTILDKIVTKGALSARSRKQ